MSYDFMVYASSKRLPTAADFSRLLQRLNPSLRVEDMPPLLQLDGFLPATLDGVATGFEVLIVEITDERRERARESLAGEPDDGYLDALETSDTKFTLMCHDDTEIAAARIFAQTLARAVNGYFADPQVGSFDRLA